MSTTKVQPQDLVNAAKDLQDLNGQYIARVTAVYQAADELNSKWKGNARDAFVNQLANMQKPFNELGNIITEYVGFLNKAAQEYQEGDNAARTAITSAR